MTQLSPPAAQKGAPATKRRRSSKTPTARALEDLREMGFTAGKVEKFNSFTKRFNDFLGCLDIIACRPGIGIVGIQVTTNDGGNHSNHLKKMLAEPRLRPWIESGGRVELWSYAKQGARGAVKCWVLRREEILLAHLPASEAE